MEEKENITEEIKEIESLNMTDIEAGRNHYFA